MSNKGGGPGAGKMKGGGFSKMTPEDIFSYANESSFTRLLQSSMTIAARDIVAKRQRRDDKRKSGTVKIIMKDGKLL